MLTPFAKLVLFALFAIAALALLVMRVAKWWKNRSASTAPRTLDRQTPSPVDNDPTMASPFARANRRQADDVPMARPLDSSSILIGNQEAPKTVVAPAVKPSSSVVSTSGALKPGSSVTNLGASSAANSAYLRDVPDLPDLDPGDVPTSGTGDYRYGEAATKSFAALLPETENKKKLLKQELVNAGQYEPHAYDNFRAVRAIGVFGSILLCLLALVFLPARFEGMAIIGLVVLPLIFWALPTVVIRGKAADRRREIENGMPDMLDLLSMCVSQGMTVPNSLNRVATELKPVYPALSQELMITGEHARVGSLGAAMEGLNRRVDTPEVHSFTSLVTQTESMGTSVSESLEVYSDGIREGLRQRADQKANTAAFKLLFPTVLFLMPAVFLFLLGPALLDIADFFNSGTAEGVLNSNSAANFNIPTES